MRTMKKCEECGNYASHWDDSDPICMNCERLIYYPDDHFAESFINTIKVITQHGV
jgi:hypothetical protein